MSTVFDIDCEYIGECSSYPYMCYRCKHSHKRGKDYFEPEKEGNKLYTQMEEFIGEIAEEKNDGKLKIISTDSVNINENGQVEIVEVGDE